MFKSYHRIFKYRPIRKSTLVISEGRVTKLPYDTTIECITSKVRQYALKDPSDFLRVVAVFHPPLSFPCSNTHSHTITLMPLHFRCNYETGAAISPSILVHTAAMDRFFQLISFLQDFYLIAGMNFAGIAKLGSSAKLVSPPFLPVV